MDSLEGCVQASDAQLYSAMLKAEVCGQLVDGTVVNVNPQTSDALHVSAESLRRTKWVEARASKASTDRSPRPALPKSWRPSRCTPAWARTASCLTLGRVSAGARDCRTGFQPVHGNDGMAHGGPAGPTWDACASLVPVNDILTPYLRPEGPQP